MYRPMVAMLVAAAKATSEPRPWGIEIRGVGENDEDRG